MTDLISRQAAIDALGEEPPVWYDDEYEIAERNQWRMDVAAIEAVPSANQWRRVAAAIEAVSSARPKGKWEVKSFHEVFCNKCGFDFDIMTNDFLDKMNFCPNCGADMRGGDNETD